MLISDWSSDVCSSDLEEQKASLDTLGGELEQRKQAVTELQDQQRTAQNELAEVRKQAQEKRGRLSSLETLQHAALGQEQGAAVEWLRQHGLDSAARVGERLEVEAGWENARSEEHTSELQSLMRISYAVFCLKKKKNQQNAR